MIRRENIIKVYLLYNDKEGEYYNDLALVK
jgi:hypothetical protein